MLSATPFRPLVCLLLLLVMPGATARKGAEATMPPEFAAQQLAAKVHILRVSRAERAAGPPGLGPMAAALSHAYGHPLSADPEERRLMEDIPTVLETDPTRAHEVPALRSRMIAHSPARAHPRRRRARLTGKPSSARSGARSMPTA